MGTVLGDKDRLGSRYKVSAEWYLHEKNNETRPAHQRTSGGTVVMSFLATSAGDAVAQLSSALTYDFTVLAVERL